VPSSKETCPDIRVSIPTAFERRKDRALAVGKRFGMTFSHMMVQDFIVKRQGNPTRQNGRFAINNLTKLRPSPHQMSPTLIRIVR
jgi:hypothetical protein